MLKLKFRHSKLTDLARKGMRETAMREFSGWTENSIMPSVYLHLTDDDVNLVRMELETGVKSRPVEPEKSSLLPINCPRGGQRNDATSKFCVQCWSPLQQEVMQLDIMLLEMLRSNFLAGQVDVDKLTRDYSAFKMTVSDLETVLKLFN